MRWTKGGVRRCIPIGGAALSWTVSIAKTEGRMQKDYADICKHISNNLGQLR
ncbi:carboxymuconolactone decarboxylase family protein, partial [Bradyrhizobium elkanii]|nr:carboxymuconolactone decarboxylase family protein [Bradyrhizobium elkanii]